MKIELRDAVMLGTMLFAMGGAWFTIDSRLSMVETSVAKLDVTDKIHDIEIWIARWEGKWPDLAQELKQRGETP